MLPDQRLPGTLVGIGFEGQEDHGLALPGVVKGIDDVKGTEESLRAFYRCWAGFTADDA